MTDSINDTQRAEGCAHEWRDGWGMHMCFNRGEHTTHRCECDATKWTGTSVPARNATSDLDSGYWAEVERIRDEQTAAQHQRRGIP